MLMNKYLNKNYLFIIPILLLPIFLRHGYGTEDVIVFLDTWYAKYQEFGLLAGYSHLGDNYPPLSYIITVLNTKTAIFLGINRYILHKMMLALFLFCSTGILYFISKDVFVSILFYLFSLIISVGLGYLDIMFAPFLIFSLYYLAKDNLILFIIFYMTSILIKFQPLIIAPFIIVYIIKKYLFKIKIYKIIFIDFILTFFIIIIIVWFIFGVSIYDALKCAIKHRYLSGNALNFNWILTYLLHVFKPNEYGALKLNGLIQYIEPITGITYYFSKTLFFFSYTLIFIKQILSKENSYINMLFVCTVGYLCYFIFNIGVHENHLFPIIILTAMMVYLNKEYLSLFIVWSLFFQILI